jgi:hypothetical protein
MKAMRGEATPDCRFDECVSCGACAPDLAEICLAEKGAR